MSPRISSACVTLCALAALTNGGRFDNHLLLRIGRQVARPLRAIQLPPLRNDDRPTEQRHDRVVRSLGEMSTRGRWDRPRVFFTPGRAPTAG